MTKRKENLIYIIKQEGGCINIRCNTDCPFFKALNRRTKESAGCTRTAKSITARKEQCISLFLSDYGTKEELVEALI